MIDEHGCLLSTVPVLRSLWIQYRYDINFKIHIWTNSTRS